MSTDPLETTKTEFDIDARWRIHDQVRIRPERFGALLYHFETRRLSFIKSRKLLNVLQSLETEPTVREALIKVGVTKDDHPNYVTALGNLAQSQMILRTS